MPTPVRAAPLPPNALLMRYRDAGHYTDCYATHVAGRPAHAAYVEAFYTSWVFRLERAVLALASLPSTDAEVTALAAGPGDAFAAWQVEARATGQLLLCDVHGRTRSWLMTVVEDADAGGTLYFGTAVVPEAGAAPGASLGFPYAPLLGFHRVYSRILLRAAAARLERAMARLQ
jgi:hypothetical protein